MHVFTLIFIFIFIKCEIHQLNTQTQHKIDLFLIYSETKDRISTILHDSSGKHVRVLNTPLNPTYSKTGVCRGIPIFLIFAPKHRLWVLVRTASARRFLRVRTIYVLSKNKKNIKFFQLKFFNF